MGIEQRSNQPLQMPIIKEPISGIQLPVFPESGHSYVDTTTWQPLPANVETPFPQLTVLDNRGSHAFVVMV
jgi:hypothetical protein